MDPAGFLGRPIVDAVLGGFWELTLEPYSVALNTDRLGPSLDQLVERAVALAVESIAAPPAQRRLLLEVEDGRFFYIHDYHPQTGAGVRSRIGDAFPLPPEAEPPPPPGDPQEPDLRDNWPGGELRLEPAVGEGRQLIAIQAPPEVTPMGDMWAVVQTTARVGDLTEDGMRFNMTYELQFVARRDFPMIPLFETLDMQRGEALPAKVTFTFTVRRSATPAELGLPRAEEVEGGFDAILPLAELVQAAFYGEEWEP